MGDRIKGITRRIKRLFVKEGRPAPPKRLSASLVVRPEAVIPQHGKPAPKTTRRQRRVEDSPSGLTITVLLGGVTHVIFPRETYRVPVRDPVTRRLSRKGLKDGMRKITNYYDDRGRLISDNDVRW